MSIFFFSNDRKKRQGFFCGDHVDKYCSKIFPFTEIQKLSLFPTYKKRQVTYFPRLTDDSFEFFNLLNRLHFLFLFRKYLFQYVPIRKVQWH